MIQKNFVINIEVSHWIIYFNFVGHDSEDFSFPNDGFWDTQPVTKDSAVSLGNISFEEELLMADAAEAIEATMNESDFLEETIF